MNQRSTAAAISIFSVSAICQILLIARVGIVGFLHAERFAGALIGLAFLALLGFLVYFNRSQPGARMQKADAPQSALKPRQKGFLWFSLGLISLAGWAIRVVTLIAVPANAPIADMLPLIKAAALAFLSGQTPYQVFLVPHPLPLTFLPGLWLPYLPAVAAGVDLRWVGLLIWLVITGLLAKAILDLARRNPSPLVLILAVVNFGLLQFSPEFFLFHAYGHTYTYWLWLALICYGVLKEQDVLTAVGLGLAIASRQTLLILIPIIGFYWLHRAGLPKTLRLGGITAGLGLLIILPFAAQSPEQVFVVPIQHYQALADADFLLGAQSYMASTIGFAYFIRFTLPPQTLTLLSGIIVGLVSLIAFFQAKNRQQTLICMAAGLAWLNLLTPIPWAYVYYPELIILAFALAIEK